MHEFAHIGYNAALAATSPLWAAYVLSHGSRRGRGLTALREQLGRLAPDLLRESQDRIWVHGVSAGETIAGMPIVNGLAEALPDAELVFSSTTIAGQQVARSKLSAPKHFVHFPLDLPFAVKRSLAIIRPRVFASVEAEIWPNFLHYAHNDGVRTAVVNGTVTDRTLRRARPVGWVYRWALSCVDRFCMQTDRDAERIVSLGAPPERVSVFGNTKFDEPFPILGEADKRALRAELGLGDGCEVFLAGSANPGEDEPVIDAFVQARQSRRALTLIIAPRQLDRAEAIAAMARLRGLRAGLRTGGLDGGEDVIILNTMGELAKVYAIASVAFVGGTLIPKGGHNLLQPIAQGKPVLFGPYTFKTSDVARMVLDAGVGFRVSDSEELGFRIADLLASQTRLAEIAEAARALIAANKGAAARCVEAIVELYGRSAAGCSRVEAGTHAL